MDWVNVLLLTVIFIALIVLIQRLMKPVGWFFSNPDFVCANCGGYIVLSPWQILSAMHVLGKRWVRCPHCGEMTWALPIRK